MGSNSPAMRGYTTSQVSDLIGMKPAQVRHLVRRSLLAPSRGGRGEYRFGFQDVVLLRTAKGLLESRVSSRRTVRTLLKLQNALGQRRGLASLRIFADAEAAVLVRERNQLWEAETGQARFDFGDLAGAGPQVARLEPPDLQPGLPPGVQPHFQPNLIVAREVDALDSDDWYNLGLDLEESGSPRAAEAYRRSLELDPGNADACVNLGRLRQLGGDLPGAVTHYQQALEINPDHQLALYNLGTVHDEWNELEQARSYYLRAPGVPDAHYNLARLCELTGDELSARRYMRSYRQLLDLQ